MSPPFARFRAMPTRTAAILRTLPLPHRCRQAAHLAVNVAFAAQSPRSLIAAGKSRLELGLKTSRSETHNSFGKRARRGGTLGRHGIRSLELSCPDYSGGERNFLQSLDGEPFVRAN